MSVREIVLWPDPRLSQVCVRVEQVDTGVRQQAEDMLETMYAAPGRGLAAPQIGVMNRMFVMDATWKDGLRDPMVFVNPEIVWVSPGQAKAEEGCLSIPGVMVRVSRPANITLRWTSLDGETHERRFDGFAAACLQHELDHLDGIVTFDRLAPDLRAEAEAEYAA